MPGIAIARAAKSFIITSRSRPSRRRVSSMENSQCRLANTTSSRYVGAAIATQADFGHRRPAGLQVGFHRFGEVGEVARRQAGFRVRVQAASTSANRALVPPMSATRCVGRPSVRSFRVPASETGQNGRPIFCAADLRRESRRTAPAPCHTGNRERSACSRSPLPLRGVDQGIQRARLGVQPDRRMAAGTLPEAPDMRPSVTSATLIAAVLQHAERRGQLVQLRHAVGARPLEPDHGDDVAIEFAGLEGVHQGALVVEDATGASMTCVRLHGRDLMTARPRFPSAAAGRRRPGNGRTGAAPLVLAGRWGRPRQAVRRRRAGSRARARAAVAPDGQDIGMQQAGVEQLADQEGHAAGGVEVVHVGRAVRIDAGEQRDRVGQFGEIVPGRSMPAARAMATRWIAWLVEPPVACSPTMPLTTAFSSTTAPTGV